jgi:starch-binding outer membrane protein, SusD/RagB family
MNLIKIVAISSILAFSFFGCSDDLAVENPNTPTPSSLNTESGLISFATGGVYVTGFKNVKYTDGVFGPFWSGATGFHEMMGDVLGCDAANALLNQIGCPNKVIYDDGTTVLNPNSPNTQYGLVRQANTNQQGANNFLYYEWAYMYNLISSCNVILEKVSTVEFKGADAPSKKAAIETWAYWWKGFAYSRIGSIYYAGLIQNKSGETNGNYVSKEKIIAEATKMFDSALNAAKSAPDAAVFTSTLARIIPIYYQEGKGAAMSPDMFERNINSMKARNILVNKTTATMTAADWQSILTLANNGIKADDNVFTVRSDVNSVIFSTGQLLMGRTYSNAAGGATYKISERWVQEFKAGDKRLAQNIVSTGAPYTGQADRGNAHFTRHALVPDGPGKLDGVHIFAKSTPGDFEMFIGVNFEENELMKAEALINTNQVDQGLLLVDGVRNVQGAGLDAVSGKGLSLDNAKEELRRERRIVCALRGLSFYDARRWGVIDLIANGGGRKGAYLLSNAAKLSTNGTIEYGFLDYWDVPGNETAYNPPAAGSDPIKNPK